MSTISYPNIDKPTSLVSIVNQDGTIANIGGSGTASSQVQGNVANGATDTGNPVKIGAVFRSTIPTYTEGQRTESVADANGNVRSLGIASAFTATDNMTNVIGRFYSQGSSTNSVTLGANNCVYNQITGGWDRQRGDTLGTWSREPPVAGTARNITATNTSQSLMAANTSRSKVFIKNDTAIDVWINIGATAVATAGAGNIKIPANGGAWEFSGFSEAINIISGGANAAITAREW